MTAHLPPPPAPDTLAHAASRPLPTISRAQAIVALAAGGVASVAVPWQRPGVGVGVAGVAVAVAVLVGRRPRSTSAPDGATDRPASPAGAADGPALAAAGGPALEAADGPAPAAADGPAPAADRIRDPWRAALALVVLASLVVPAITDAVWVVTLALVTAAGCAALAVGGGATWRGLTRTGFAAIVASIDGLEAIVRSTGQLVPSGPRRSSVVRTTALTTGLLTVFGALFVSADQAFGSLVGRYLRPDVDVGIVTWHVGTVIGVSIVVTGLVLLPVRRVDTPLGPPRRQLRGSEWSVPLGALVALFAAFVAVQFPVLFGGHGRVRETAGLTYASYAHQGFAQLVVVAVLTLAVVVAAHRWAVPSGAIERVTRQVLLGMLCALTLVVLLSARHRLVVYEQAFGATRLRLGAQTIIVWLAVLFVVVLVAGAAGRTRALPRTVVLVTAVAVVAFGASRPDATVASANVDRFETTGQVDLDHLRRLSADAVPALTRLPPALRACAVEPHVERLEDPSRAWGAWNLSRARANDLLRGQSFDCDPKTLVDARAASGAGYRAG